MKKEKNISCMLGINPLKSNKCEPSECAKCGWNKKVAEERKKQLRKQGLRKCKDGYYRAGGDKT